MMRSTEGSPPANDDSSGDDSCNSSVGTKRSEDAAEHEADDSPEALIRQENTVIRFSRAFVLLVLLIAAAVASSFIYIFTRDTQQKAFAKEVDGIGAKIIESLLSDTTLRFWLGFTISNAVTTLMSAKEVSHLELHIPAPEFERLTLESRTVGSNYLSGWSPILNDDDDRETFEQFVANTTANLNGAYAPCYLCGTPEMGFSNPDTLFDLIGYGTYKCGDFDEIGRKGTLVTEEQCPLASLFTAGTTCTCAVLPDDSWLLALTDKVEVPSSIFHLDVNSIDPVTDPKGTGPYVPYWQTASTNIKAPPTMYNQMTEAVRAKALNGMMNSSIPVLSETLFNIGERMTDLDREYMNWPGHPVVVTYFPIFHPTQAKIVGKRILNTRTATHLTSVIQTGVVNTEASWMYTISGVVPPNSHLVDIVVENTCGQSFTFRPNSTVNTLDFLGDGDLHDSKYDHMVTGSTYEQYDEVVYIVVLASRVSGNVSASDHCRYRFKAYPTDRLRDIHVNKDPLFYALVTCGIFFFTSLVFVFYDTVVGRRQRKVMRSANQTSEIVTNLFPENIRARLMQQGAQQMDHVDPPNVTGDSMVNNKSQMQEVIADGGTHFSSEAIADFFPSCTVIYIDIENFTAWSSERSPAQVFQLLENLFNAFDNAGRGRGVFKVETIADAYVAVAGVPKARKDHAIVMARFARVCLQEVARLTKELEKYLGPSTGDLRVRVGMNSGSIVAGVLRGSKSRYQIFGATANTAARIQASGKPGLIHASKATADALIAAGKGHWVVARSSLVNIKGKGEVKTFWVNPKERVSLSDTAFVSTRSLGDEDQIHGASYSKLMRLVDWNVEVLYALLERVAASNSARNQSKMEHSQALKQAEMKQMEESQKKGIVLDEMTQILHLPPFDPQTMQPPSVQLPGKVKMQLKDFVLTVSKMYRDVPFHNFDHSSHVIMSAGKLMKRIVNPDDIEPTLESKKNEDPARSTGESPATVKARAIYNSTYGISGDPLMQFAVVFSALIHDADHTGLSNAELVEMNADIAKSYRNKSVAEQNSVDLVWRMFMRDRFAAFRACVYTNKQELQRFRQLIVNAVMATDIADKELQTLRKSRWDDAFQTTIAESQEQSPASVVKDDMSSSDLKATITFEYIIQASDQHWQTYQKFNFRLFEERYVAWLRGAAKNPVQGWYGGEIWFFDNYIIPLAQKLNKCGVFGVSYDEFLSYAIENREEWKAKGHIVVADMLKRCEEKYAQERAGASWSGRLDL